MSGERQRRLGESACALVGRLSAEDDRAERDDQMTVDRLRQQISEFLGFSIPETSVPFATHNAVEEHGHSRIRISYPSQEGEQIPAFLLLPEGDGPFAAVLVHHQHHGERHLGKSEVCGLVGDPLQAFGPALARQGVVVLAPDSICFEDRRRDRTGTEADEAADVEQHYNEMCYRLLRGDTLMRKVLSDSAQGISLLRAHPLIDPERVGIMGHSYGGNTVLFHGALDERIRFACSSGAACTYQHKMAHQTGIEMAEAIPGFAARYDIPDLVTCFAPRRVLLVSATEDKYSRDADRIVTIVRERAAAMGIAEQIEHKRYEGGHASTQERFDDIVHWLVTSVE
jgi:dienelactone hydrolase